MTRLTLVPVLFAGLLGLAACGSSSTSPTNAPTATTVAMKDGDKMTETTVAMKDGDKMAEPSTTAKP